MPRARSGSSSFGRKCGGIEVTTGGAAALRRPASQAWLSLVAVVTVTTLTGCTSRQRVSEETHREAVTAFYVSLAALQTSQDVLARKELDRLVQLVPDEPAGWANLGLLFLRQQQFDGAEQRLTRAAQLAPRNAQIERLLAVAASREGDLEASVRHWRRAMALDTTDLRAPYALALELERLGGAANEAEAQRLLEPLASGARNLAARLEFARVAGKRSDRPALAKAVEWLTQEAPSWPAGARERLTALREAAQRSPAEATRAVIFLKNVLIREPEYRAALAAVSTPGEIGEPMLQFVVLPNPEPHPAPADERLAFAIDPSKAVTVPNASWAGVAWLTADGPPAVLAAGSGELRLDTGVIVPVPGTSRGASAPEAVAIADLNYDFRSDVVLAGSAGLQILTQQEEGAFVPVTSQARIPPGITSAPAQGVWAADFDVDGDLDLVLALRDAAPAVLRNNGDNTFVAQHPFGSVRRLRGFVWADVDGEGVPDAGLLDAEGAVRVFLNLRGAGFRERQVPSAFAHVMAIAPAEISGDGLVDVVGVVADGSVARLSYVPARSDFEARTIARVALPSTPAAGTVRLLVADVDNNGAADLVVSSPTASRVAVAVGDGSFREVEAGTVPGGLTSAADLDGDGRLELVGVQGNGARVLRVSGQKRYRWQAVRPRAATATGDQRINSFGIGGEIEIRTGLHAQKQVIASPVVHFGLGTATRAEVARITWPNGVLQSEFDLAADAVVAASQRLKGSCPWLFAWNGSAMAFVTDLMWRSPLGLRINAQDTADVQMTEDWIKVRGDQLAARNGEYDLRITAELWETHFFDLVSLLVVDHPDGTEAFVDERFAVPPPGLGVILTSPVHDLLAARDDRGRDVLTAVRARDDQHLDFAGRGRYQGVTREHSVEMELPEAAPRSGPLYLVAQGWVHPTDSSINVALGQGAHPAPTGLSLHVADVSGRFRPTRTGLGFPAGKDKTVLIDLTGVFPRSGARQLRLSTNLEVFWDRLGWAVGRPGAPIEQRRLESRRADLRFRGYSVTAQKDPGSPERPRYVLEGVAARWRDLEGFYTRWGDVRELLRAVDDRYVIMNAGDELQLTFPEAPAPRQGFVRDFVLIGDGWIKDGDYNTVASRTVLPLPLHCTPTYAEAVGDLEDDPVYRAHPSDFKRYHTRYVSADPARDALRIRIPSSVSDQR